MTTPAAPASAKTAGDRKKSSYVVLRYVAPPTSGATSGPTGWQQIASTFDANNGSDALKQAAAKEGNKPGRYVAIPASSWKPQNVTAETVTTLKLEDAK